jgi:hypothetical protein
LKSGKHLFSFLFAFGQTGNIGPMLKESNSEVVNKVTIYVLTRAHWAASRPSTSVKEVKVTSDKKTISNVMK